MDDSLSGRHTEAISFRNVSFGYNGQTSIVRNIDFSIPHGTWLGIIGPTASGKSTILRLLLGLHLPDGGNIEVNGTPLSEDTIGTIRNQFSVALQEPRLFGDTVGESIACGNEAEQTAIADAAEAASVLSEILVLPEGFSTNVGVRASMLSGGQRQRIALARALYRDRQILVLDDITASVDVEVEHDIIRSLRDRHSSKTVIIVSHRVAALRSCDRILVVRDGEIESDGNHMSLRRDSQFYQAVCNLQEHA